MAACLAVLLAGCALRAADLAPLPTDPAEFGGWPCARIQEEIELVQRNAVQLAYDYDGRAGTNLVAMGIGVAVFWPALLAYRGAGSDGAVLAALKGRHEALRAAAAARPCEAPAAGSSAPVAGAPLRVSDLLVYEQRINTHPRTPTQVIRLRIDELGRQGLRLQPLLPGVQVQPAPEEPWQQDRLGNLRSASVSPIWPELVRSELNLGTTVSGELIDLADAGLAARVRGQVVAVGPQSIAGRPFDVAVIDLVGDAVGGLSRARVDGVLVVDRLTGALLRLDLASGISAFQLQRRLVRVEAGS